MNWSSEELQQGMSIILFGLGVLSSLAGLWTILAREYQSVMHDLSTQSARIANETIAEKGIQETVQAVAELVHAVSELVRTATGVGLVLLASGLGICYLAYHLVP